MTGLAIAAAVASCGDNSSPTKPSPAPCSFSLSAQNQSFPSDGGTGSVNIATDAQCSWTAEGAGDWISLVSGQSGTGPGAVSFKVLANPGQSPREKTLTLATMPFKVSQAGSTPCSFAIAPEQHAVDDDGGTGEVHITAADGCSWTAQSHDSWITITSGAEGRGSGTVKYTVAVNGAPTSRTGTLTIAGRTHKVSQDGQGVAQPIECQFSVAPVSFTPCMPGGSLTATVTTQASCAWTASPGASWLSIVAGGSGNGSGTVTISFSDNYDAPREGVVMVRWPTPSQGQNIHVAQAGCTYAVSRNIFAFTSAAATGTFDVIQQSQPTSCGGATQDRCVWMAESNVPWITITSSMPRSGDDPVAFAVAANTGAARSGTITVRGVVVTITQAAP